MAKEFKLVVNDDESITIKSILADGECWADAQSELAASVIDVLVEAEMY
jgi:hypothetical protein